MRDFLNFLVFPSFQLYKSYQGYRHQYLLPVKIPDFHMRKPASESIIVCLYPSVFFTIPKFERAAFQNQPFRISLSESAFQNQPFRISLSESAFQNQPFRISLSESAFQNQPFRMQLLPEAPFSFSLQI